MDLLNTDGSTYTGPNGEQYGAVIVRIGRRDVVLGTYQFAPGAVHAPHQDEIRRVLLDDTTAVSTDALAQALREVAEQVDPSDVAPDLDVMAAETIEQVDLSVTPQPKRAKS